MPKKRQAGDDRGTATPSKKRRRSVPAGGDEALAAAAEPIEQASAPEWAPLLSALSALGSSCERPPLAASEDLAEPFAQMGGAVLSVLQRVLELHRLVGDCDGGANVAAEHLGPANLSLPPSGDALLPSLRVPVYERVAATTRHAHGCFEAAVGGGSSAGKRARGSSSLCAGPPTAGELADDDDDDTLSRPFASLGPSDERRAFRDSYMALLADGAADELDALRREEPPMDEAALATLVDALEYGAETFAPRQRRLLGASFSGTDSWWERRGKGEVADAPPRDSKKRVAEMPATAPPLIARVRELQKIA